VHPSTKQVRVKATGAWLIQWGFTASGTSILACCIVDSTGLCARLAPSLL
jgi:hypothetical protein